MFVTGTNTRPGVVAAVKYTRDTLAAMNARLLAIGNRLFAADANGVLLRLKDSSARHASGARFSLPDPKTAAWHRYKQQKLN